MFYSFHQWNLILFLLCACSFASCAIFLERFFSLRRAEADSDRFLLSLRTHIEDGNLVAAIEHCEHIGGSLAHVVKAGLLRHHRPQQHIENAMETAGRLEIARLEKNTRLLSIVSYIAPLIGLLGTVLGFIQAFGEMRLSGLSDITTNNLGAALEYALITTAAGLAVAIPTLLGYNYLVSRIENIVLEIQVTSSEVVELLLLQRDNY